MQRDRRRSAQAQGEPGGEQATDLRECNVVLQGGAAPSDHSAKAMHGFGEFKNANNYNYCLIIVENSDEDVQVPFYLTDADEMNWVTEFLDAPFFTQTETQKLFGLLNSGHDVRGQKVERFRVDFHRWEPRHAQILVLSFTRN